MAVEIAEIQASIARLRSDSERRHALGSGISLFIRELERVALRLPEMSDVDKREAMRRLFDIGEDVCAKIGKQDPAAGRELEDALLSLGILQVDERQQLEAMVAVAASALRLGSGNAA